ncbi:DUF4292 domain-containing protein [Candidatus Sumerlaeota bacterium]
MRQFRIASFLLLLTAGLSGCAGLRARPFVSPYTVEFGRLTQAEARETIARRNPPLETFWAQADIVAKVRRRPGKFFCLATILYRQPDNFRVRGHRSNGAVLVFDYLQSGDEVGLHFPQDGQYFTGPLDDLAAAGGPLARLNPALAVRMLLVEPGLVENLREEAREEASEVEWRAKRRYYALTLKRAGVTYEYRLRKSDLLPLRLTLRGPKGKKIARAEYGEYALHTSQPYPTTIEFTYYPASSVTTFKVREVKLDPALSPAVFRVRAPAGAEVLPLRRLK